MDVREKRQAEETLKRLLEIRTNAKTMGDAEAAHGRADAELVALLKALGLRRVVTAYDAVKKWYA